MLLLAVLMCTGVALGAPTTPGDITAACAEQEANQGCCTYCGYEPTKAGDDMLCMPSGPRTPFPFAMGDGDDDEYCQLVATNHGCNDICGYKWDSVAGKCTKATPTPIVATGDGNAAPIIGGQGKYRYQYMPELLQMPGASLVNCHGLVTDKDNNIFLTYQNDGKDTNCLIKWEPDGTGGEFQTAGAHKLCDGTPHGLKILTEGDEQFLYHANNNQKLTKTKLDGTIVWQNTEILNPKAYRPTWHANGPGSRYNYMCDGYGSNQVYAMDTTTGQYMNVTWGGHSPAGQKGPGAPHGTFSTNHGCTYDPRTSTAPNTIVVSDRANSRFEFFNFDPDGYNKFEWYKTVNFEAMMGKGTLPCNIRMYPDLGGISIVPDLAGPVAVMNSDNVVVSVVNVSVLLAAEQHKHPHDAIFLPNGDMVVATWAPGRISYWKLLPADDEETEAAEM